MLVDLALVRDPALVLQTLSQTLGVSPVGDMPLLERLRVFLEDRTILLLIDNFEQVLPAASQLVDLLAVCPGVRLLVTSRIPLQLRWEHILRIKPLPVPDLTDLTPPLPLDELGQVPAVRLFVERARARQADFALTEAQARLVAELVVSLDGLPLALELAAARLDALSLPLLVRLLGDHLQMLEWEARDLPERQRSLEAAINWSYELLDTGEQRLFRHLGVFVGQVTPTALAAVLGAPTTPEMVLGGLVSLAEKSLIVRGQSEDDGEEEDERGLPAFRVLETLREYARERLERAGELEAACRAHAHYFLELAERADPLLRGREQRAWFMRLERKRSNLRAALRWLLDQDEPDEREAGLRLALALGYFWRFRGYHGEGANWLERALVRAPHVEEANPAVRTRARVEAGALLVFHGDAHHARAVLEEALALARQQQDATAITQALIFLGTCALYVGEAAQAVPLLEEALRRALSLGDPPLIGNAQYFLGATAQAQGNTREAIKRYSEALEIAETAGDMRGAATLHVALAALLGQRGDLEDLPAVVAHVREGLAASVTLQDRWLLSLAARAALSIVGEHVDPAEHARLQGAVDTQRQATGAGMGAWEHAKKDHGTPGHPGQSDPPAQAAAYREGRSLSMGEVADFALRLVERVAQIQASDTAASPGETARPSTDHGAHRENTLTEREQEVLRLVAQGLGNKAIAHQLIISPSTVNYHLIQIFNKLAVGTRAQAVAVAAQHGLI
ncbi:MAG: LuxR C-terminal-related transcriptional regulator [Ktedonobacterales bacterium]